MEHHRLRKYRGPETWAHARAAYIAGESGPSVARRLDVGLSNLRRRAMAEGWTRAAIASQLDLKPIRGGADAPSAGLAAVAPPARSLAGEPHTPVHPRLAILQARDRAAWLVSQGHAAEATALLRAVEALDALDYRVEAERKVLRGER
jgi:hypothetical protein